MREQFEKWALSNGYAWRDRDGQLRWDFDDPMAGDRLESAWQAAVAVERERCASLIEQIWRHDQAGMEGKMGKRKIHAINYLPFSFTLCRTWPANTHSNHRKVTCKKCIRILQRARRSAR